MQQALELLDWLSKIFPLATIGAAALAFYFREKIRQILSRSMSKELEQLRAKIAADAALQNAKLQRDIEAYKVTLIAEAERIRARQEVKTSLALRIAEKRFNAIDIFHNSHTGLSTVIATHVRLDLGEGNDSNQHFVKLQSEILDRLKGHAAALDAATVFLPQEIRSFAIDFREAAINLIGRRPSYLDPPIEMDDDQLERLRVLSSKTEASLLNLIKSMEDLSPSAH